MSNDPTELAFNAMVANMLQLRKPSMREMLVKRPDRVELKITAAYRGERILYDESDRMPAKIMCPIGCLIPDKLYHPDLEGLHQYDAAVRGAIDPIYHGADLMMLEHFQVLHDLYHPEWPGIKRAGRPGLESGRQHLGGIRMWAKLIVPNADFEAFDRLAQRWE